MPLSAEEQALFDHAKNTLPRFLTAGVSSAFEWLYAFTEVFEASRSQVSDWIDQSYLENATGRYLEQHAKDRGTSRRNGESDDSLRERLRQYEDMLTYPAILAAVNTILIAADPSSDECAIFALRLYRAHFQMPGDSSAFFSRGYRMANATTPMAYIVILPYGTTSETGAAVEEYLRQFGPAGYYFIVEIRGVP